MKKLLITLLILTVMISACRKNKTISQIKHDGLTLFAKKMVDDPDNTGIVNYAVKIIPDHKLNEMGQPVRTAMAYRMDSCFYLLNGLSKTYPDLIQPIANGASDSFEYLLSFRTGDLERAKGLLNYQDRYLNQKNYRIVLCND
jgi:hypothetical protein